MRSRHLPDFMSKSISIKIKLFALLSILVGLISLFIYWYFPAKFADESLRMAREKAISVSNMTAFHIQFAVFFDDKVDARDIIRATRQYPDLYFVVVLDSDDALFMYENLPLADELNYEQVMDISYVTPDQNYLITRTPIMHSSQKIGQLYLGFSLHTIQQEIEAWQWTISMLSLLIFLLGTVIAFGISTLLTNPLRQMVRTVQLIAEGDLTRRAPVQTNDEVGYLARSFNAMVDNLESAYRNLEDLNESLEKRVDERTAKLVEEIKERERVEEELRKLSRAVEQSPSMVVITDLNGIIEYVNPRFTEVTGYMPGEVIGQNVTFLAAQNGAPEIGTELWDQIARGETWMGEFKNRKKNGDSYWESALISPVLNADGEVTHYLSVKEDITERRRVMDSLLQLEKAVETMQVGVTVANIHGIITYVNPADAAMHGYTREELIGQQANVYAPRQYRKPLTQEKLNQMTSWRRETINVRKDDTPFPVYLWSDVVKNRNDEPIGLVTICEDITERKQAQIALAAEKERLAVTLRSIGDGVITTDTDGHVLLINRVAESMTGWTEAEATGKPLSEVYKTTENTDVGQSTPATVGYVTQNQLQSRDGQTYWITESKAPIHDAEGNTIGQVVVFHDITETQQLERAKANFLNAISHELRTPLTPILGYAEMLLDLEMERERQHFALEQIIKSAKRQKKLVDELISVARLESGTETFNLVSLNAFEYFNNIVDQNRILIEFSVKERYGETPFQFEYDISPALENIMLRIDTERFQQVIQNLLINAVKYSPTDRIHIHLDVETVPPQNGQSSPQVRIKIADQGFGIPRSEWAKIFNPFYQIRKSSIDISDGVGHGLTIVKRYVQAHGGTIHLDSTPGDGTTFFITLPAQSES